MHAVLQDADGRNSAELATVKRWKAATLGIAALLLALALAGVFFGREPRFQGKSLTDWLVALKEQPASSEPFVALRGMGKRGVRHMSRMLFQRQNTLGYIWAELVEELPGYRTRNRRSSSYDKQSLALHGLIALGPAARSALPAMMHQLQQDPSSAQLWALVRAMEPGPPDFPFFADFIAHPNSQRSFAAWEALAILSAHPAGQTIVLAALANRTHAPFLRAGCVWSLHNTPRPPDNLAEALLRRASDKTEARLVRLASLHALGLLKASGEIVQSALAAHEELAGPIPRASVRNGSFSDLDPHPYQPMREGLPAIDQPSWLLAGWLTWAGVVGCQRANPPAEPGLELGPRDFPGAVSQLILTEPGRAYELQFRAAPGRNRELTLRAGDLITHLDTTEKIATHTFRFRAVSKLTTLLFAGRGHEGYGPFIDDVMLKPEEHLPPESRP